MRRSLILDLAGSIRADGASSAAGDYRKPIDFAEIKRLVSLAMVLSRYGVLSQLKRVGSQLAGACPIHDGSDPRQFVVHLQSGQWFCFGDCNRGGSIFEFVALRERISIPRAAHLIAEWFAIGPPRHLPPRPRMKRRSNVSNGKPSHKVFVVESRETETDSPQGGFWTQIGSAWPHQDGKGLNVQLKPNIAVSGRIVLREWDEERGKAKAGK